MFHQPHYVFGAGDVQVPAHLNFGKYILDRLRTRKYEIAFENIDTKEKLSYRDVTQYAVNLATSLIKLGVGKGDIVAIGAERRIEFIPIALGIVLTGATCNLHDLKSGRAPLKHRINITQPTYFICSRNFLEQYEEMLKGYECIKMTLSIDDAYKGMQSVKDLVKEDVDVELFEPATVLGQMDLVFILYSSGTTGLSKAVQLTHLNYLLNSLLDDDDSLKTCFILADWYHNYDTIMTFKCLASGKKIVFTEDLNSESILRSIYENEVNVLFLVPSFVSILPKEVGDLGKYNLESLRIIYSGAATLHKETIDVVKQMFPNVVKIIQGYGMTEVGEITAETWGDKGLKPGSVGKAIPGIILKVSDLETGKAVGPNTRGEICVKSLALMKGYIGIDLSKSLDNEGFFKTGDLGYYDEDKYFYIDGRLKEIIIYDGYNVAPQDLETLLQLHPGVREAGVVGKPVPDYGEVPAAFVVKQPGSLVTEQELLDYIAEEVMHYMQLRGGVKFIEEMPRNSRGKIVRQKLKDLLDEN